MKHSNFSWDDIFDLTIPQIKLFYAELGIINRYEMRNAITVALAGARYSQETVDELINNLEKT